MSRPDDPMTFTRAAATRIASAVRKVEVGDRDGGGLEFDAQQQQKQQKLFRVCTFTGAWNKNELKTVTVRNATATLSSLNLFAAIGTASGSRNCAIAKDGTAWYLIAAEC